MDTFICDLVREAFAKTHPHLLFLSEENPRPLEFPALILDPVDGTRELVRGNPEWAVSLAICHSEKLDDPKNFAWIFNPASGFELGGCASSLAPLKNKAPGKTLKGVVSHTEWPNLKKKGDATYQLEPCGSIAFKLGLISAGECDFVFSRRPKCLWDIAAGSLLARWRGFSFWQNGNEVERFERMDWPGPFLWARPEHYNTLCQLVF